jgi:hypothetical protein
MGIWKITSKNTIPKSEEVVKGSMRPLIPLAREEAQLGS